ISVKHTCYVPQMVKLESLNDYSSLKVNKWNIPEPDHDQNRDIATQLDLILMPGLAFELNRNRLDHGKGYYDKYLTKYRQWTKPPIASKFIYRILPNNWDFCGLKWCRLGLLRSDPGCG
ncbi:18266_t:CDS:2, partial [Gigaspora rosea]